MERVLVPSTYKAVAVRINEATVAVEMTILKLPFIEAAQVIHLPAYTFWYMLVLLALANAPITISIFEVSEFILVCCEIALFLHRIFNVLESNWT